MSFEEISDLTSSLKFFPTSVNQNSSCWQSVIRHIANVASIHSQIIQKNSDLQSWVELLESADKQLVQAQYQVLQSIGEKHIYKRNIGNLTEQFR